MRICKRPIAIILAMIMFLLVPFSPLSQYFTASASTASQKLFEINPSQIDPGESTNITIRVLWQYTQRADVYLKDGSGNIIRTIRTNQMINGYAGVLGPDDLPTYYEHPLEPTEITWNSGSLEEGRYYIVVTPQSERFRYDESKGILGVGEEASGYGSSELFVDPDLDNGEFRFHGPSESGEDKNKRVDREDYKETVFIDTQSVKLNIDGKSYDASVDSSTWSFTLPEALKAYKIVDVTGEKINKVTREKETREAYTVTDTDSEGHTSSHTEYRWIHETNYEDRTIPLDSITLADYVVKDQDLIDIISNIYFGNVNHISDIRSDNKVGSTWVPKDSNHVLVLNTPGIFYNEDSVNKEILTYQSEKYGQYTVDPINIMTGNYLYRHSDIKISGGFPVELSRWYNARDNYNGLLGRNWHTSFEYRLWEKPDYVEVIYPDGTRTKFNSSGGVYTPAEAGIYDKLVKENGVFKLISKDKTQYTFNDAGQIKEIKDSNGNVSKFIYNGDFLCEVRSDSGYIIIDYTNRGLIRQVRDNTGRVVKYNYNSSNQLTSFTYPDGESVLYEYDSESRITKVTSPDREACLANQYDSEGRVVLQTFPDGSTMSFDYDLANRKTTVTERDMSVAIYSYDDQFRVTQIDHADGTEIFTYNAQNELASYTDKRGSVEEYQYDTNGNVVELSKDGDKTFYTYTENNKVKSVTDSLGNTQTFDYDTKGNLIKQTDARGNFTEYAYDSKGQVVQVTKSDGSITSLAYDSRGNVSSVTDGRGFTESYQYDELNRITAVTDKDGNVTSYEYNEDDDIIKGNLL